MRYRERDTFCFEIIGRELSGCQKVIILLSVLGRSHENGVSGTVFIG